MAGNNFKASGYRRIMELLQWLQPTSARTNLLPPSRQKRDEVLCDDVQSRCRTGLLRYLGYAYGRWDADAGDKKLGGHWTNVLVNEGGQWRTALHTWTLDQ